jgi:hypothetical protein
VNDAERLLEAARALQDRTRTYVATERAFAEAEGEIDVLRGCGEYLAAFARLRRSLRIAELTFRDFDPSDQPEQPSTSEQEGR